MLCKLKTAFHSDQYSRNIYKSVKNHELQLNRHHIKIRSGFHSTFLTTKPVLRFQMRGAEDGKHVVNAQSFIEEVRSNISMDDGKCNNDNNTDASSLKESSRKGVGKQDLVRPRQTTRGIVKTKDDILSTNTNDIDSGEHHSFVQDNDSVEQADLQIGSRKRKTTVIASQVTKLKTFVASELKRDANNLENKEEPWTMLVHKKLQPHWTSYNPALLRKPTPSSSSLKFLSWNVNGLRALLNKKCFNAVEELAKKENFDVLCLQETKLQVKDVDRIKESLVTGYEYSYWNCSTTKLGYSGTAIISRIKPISINYGLGSQDHDFEGRIITVEFDKFYLVSGYVPNSGQKLERLAYRTKDWDVCLGRFLKDLEVRKPVILAGDLNCAHQEIDIYNPDGNRKSAGFTDEERSSFEENFLNKGLMDTFRSLHQNVVAYTYWGYRTAARPKNQGWRLDYFLVSNDLLDLVYDSYILPEIGGSDHCPVGLILRA